MFEYRVSIRQKIMFAYYIGIVVTIGLSAVAFFTLRLTEKKIIFWEGTSTLFDTTLEIRRFEKNFFLYGQDSDFNENCKYIKQAQDILDSNVEKYGTDEGYQQLYDMKNALKKYKELMVKFYASKKQNSINKQLLEMMIKENGKVIVTTAENVSKFEWKKFQLFLKETMRNLVISIAVLSFIGIVIGQILAKMVVKPLKSLENRMKLIAEGTLEKVEIDSRDREIVSFTNAFNRMLGELEVRQKHLVQTEKLASLGTLLSGVAHELNNPLSNIYSSSQILSEEIETDDIDYKKELLSQIDDQTDRARNIVRSLLEFSRNKDFKKEALPLKGLIEETTLFVKGQVPAKVEIAVNIPDDIVIYADKQRIQQAFLNLIRNALQAISEEGGIYIRAQRRSGIGNSGGDESEIYNYLKYRGQCSLEEETVDIEIRDTGTGITDEILPRIFDPFFTTKEVGQGSGLGLSIVHEIIDEHDGCIAVDSRAGVGTTFIIRLPLPKENRPL